MTREEARAYFIDSNERIISVAKDENKYNYETQQIEDVFMRRNFEAKKLAIKALEQEPNTKKDLGVDCISREQALDPYKILENTDTLSVYTIRQNLAELPSVTPQEPKTGQFAKWVATEIFDDQWENNKYSFAEIACRKLAKLGIVRAKGDEWELVEQQESNVNRRNRQKKISILRGVDE